MLCSAYDQARQAGDQDITRRVDAQVADGSVVLLALSQLALPSEVVMRGPDDEDAFDLVLL